MPLSAETAAQRGGGHIQGNAQGHGDRARHQDHQAKLRPETQRQGHHPGCGDHGDRVVEHVEGQDHAAGPTQEPWPGREVRRGQADEDQGHDPGER